jgi:hypothetical protein
MVVCAVRYEPVSLLFGQYQGLVRKKQRCREYQKALQAQAVLEYHDNSISGKNRSASRSTASEQSPELGRRKSGWQSSSSGCREPKTGQWDNLMVAELRATRSVAHIGSMTRLNEFLTAAEFDALEQVDEGRNRPIPKNF